jgi:hypothetical protein
LKDIVKNSQSDSAFWEGWFSVFQPLYGQSFEMPDLKNGFERDREALVGDWQRIGSDLKLSMRQFRGHIC